MTRPILAVAAVLLGAVTASVVTGDVNAQSGAATQVTYYKDVAPVLQKNCETCHRPGQIAPMNFQTYESARPWARAIKTAGSTTLITPHRAVAERRQSTSQPSSANWSRSQRSSAEM